MSISTSTLSTRAKYIVYTGGDTQADLIIAITDALLAFNDGWERYDNAGTGTLGSSSDASRIMRRPTSDFADSGNYQYVGFRLTGNMLYWYYGSDYSSQADVTAKVNGYIINRNYLDITTGGTLWLFNETYSTIMVSLCGGLSLFYGSANSIQYIGEYKKDWGNACDASTAYIHNGVFFDPYYFFIKNGAADNNHQVYDVSVSGNATPHMGYDTVTGTYGFQFYLNECPTCADNPRYNQAYSTLDNYSIPAVVPPSSASIDYRAWATRVHLGWPGWIGSMNRASTHSIQSFMEGQSGIFERSYQYNYAKSLASRNVYNKIPNPSLNKIAVYEPLLSCGFTSPPQHQSTSAAFSMGTTPPNNLYAFALLGRPYGFRLTFGLSGYSTGGYQFLDTATLNLDADGFYDDAGNSTDCWAIPIYNNGVNGDATIFVKK